MHPGWGTQSHCSWGQRAHQAHWPGLNRGGLARARPPRGSPATTGVVGHARARERGHSTRKARAHQVEAAPPLRGHRRRRPRQRRAAVPHRNHGGRERRPRRLHGTKTRGGKVGKMRVLTPETLACSERRGEARRCRNRGRGRAVVLAVKRQRRRGDGIPRSEARRGGRGRPGAPSRPGDSSMAARSSGHRRRRRN